VSLLAWPWLLLALAAIVLLWLAWRAKRPARLEVGTLWLWRQVAAQQSESARRTRQLDLLFYSCLTALLLGALAAARPAMPGAAQPPVVAVFIERAGPPGDEPGLPELAARARELAGDAELRFYIAEAAPDLPGDWRGLRPGTFESELAQFELASGNAPRLMFLCSPEVPGHVRGRVEPRVTAPARGVVYHLRPQADVLNVRASAGPAPTAEGAAVVNRLAENDEQWLELTAEAETITLTDGAGFAHRLRRRPFVVGVGDDWTGPQHRALLRALDSDSDGTPEVWLGSRELQPAVRVNQGVPAELEGAELAYDPNHALFAELPLEAFDWTGPGRVLQPRAGRRALMTATVDGEPVGVLIGLRGGVLEFASDPFAEGPVAAAALLLDNAIGVLTGEPPTRREGYRLETSLPTRRAAHAAPFEPRGELDTTATRGPPRPLAGALLVLATLAALAAGVISLRDTKHGPPARTGGP
jgi:hypothetical protein